MNKQKTPIVSMKVLLVIVLSGMFMLPPAFSRAQNTTIHQLDKGQGDNQSVSLNEAVIYYLDAEEVSADVLKTINPNDIERMQVLKGKAATDALGEKAAEGAVLITTKKNKDAPEVKEFNEKIGKLVPEDRNDKKTGIMLGGELEGARLEDVLILVDGEKVSVNVVENLNTDRIGKVEVFKGEHAIREYGEEGKNGVIVITTK